LRSSRARHFAEVATEEQGRDEVKAELLADYAALCVDIEQDVVWMLSLQVRAPPSGSDCFLPSRGAIWNRLVKSCRSRSNQEHRPRPAVTKHGGDTCKAEKAIKIYCPVISRAVWIWLSRVVAFSAIPIPAISVTVSVTSAAVAIPNAVAVKTTSVSIAATCTGALAVRPVAVAIGCGFFC
jgi:hypothetical protein